MYKLLITDLYLFQLMDWQLHFLKRYLIYSFDGFPGYSHLFQTNHFPYPYLRLLIQTDLQLCSAQLYYYQFLTFLQVSQQQYLHCNFSQSLHHHFGLISLKIIITVTYLALFYEAFSMDYHMRTQSKTHLLQTGLSLNLECHWYEAVYCK